MTRNAVLLRESAFLPRAFVLSISVKIQWRGFEFVTVV
jgi:hypothetical protein